MYQTLRTFWGHHLRSLLRPTRALLKTEWEGAYQNGRWNYLGDLDELGHYSVLAGYCRFLKRHGDILDLGCGEGLLLRLLGADAYSQYVGVDIADAAIARAARFANERTRFIVGDIANYMPSQTFDAIVFNESLYYLPDPCATVKRLSAYLNRNGVFIVSMYLHPRHALWRRIDRQWRVHDTTQVRNRKGITWTCKVLAPRT